MEDPENNASACVSRAMKVSCTKVLYAQVENSLAGSYLDNGNVTSMRAIKERKKEEYLKFLEAERRVRLPFFIVENT